MKGTLTENLDIPNFMKMVITEAKKLGIVVISLKPVGSENKEYYVEHSFSLAFRGVYVQLIAFFERLSNISEIVRVENFRMKPLGSNKTRYVELDGLIELKTYKYVGSKADSIGKVESESLPVVPTTPAGASKPVTGGT